MPAFKLGAWLDVTVVCHLMDGINVVPCAKEMGHVYQLMVSLLQVYTHRDQ
jgi:hypothetical protein